MYSINGRLSKETATTVASQRKQHLICKECGFVLDNMSREFGEKLVCPKCGSTHLEYELD